MGNKIREPGYAVSRTFSEIQEEEIAWLWPDRFPLGAFSMIIGIQGIGKSFLSLYMAAQVSTGRPWIDRPEEKREPGDVILLSAEDPAPSIVKPRLRAVGANLDRIHEITGSIRGEKVYEGLGSLNDNMDILEDEAHKATNLKLIVIDPITAYMWGIDENKNVEVRTFVGRLTQISSKYNTAIVGISHLNKNEKLSPEHRVLGSTGFAAASRAIWLVQEDKANPDRKLMVAFKANLARRTTGLAYQIATTPLTMPSGNVIPFGYCLFEEKPLLLKASDLLTPQENGTGRPRKQESAGEWLEKYLEDGPKYTNDILREGEEAGYSQRTLERVKKAIGIQSYRSNEPSQTGCSQSWLWTLPTK